MPSRLVSISFFPICNECQIKCLEAVLKMSKPGLDWPLILPLAQEQNYRVMPSLLFHLADKRCTAL